MPEAGTLVAAERQGGVGALAGEGHRAADDETRRPIGHRLAAPASLGRATRLEDAAGRYIEAAKACFPRHLRLDDLQIVVDELSRALVEDCHRRGISIPFPQRQVRLLESERT